MNHVNYIRDSKGNPLAYRITADIPEGLCTCSGDGDFLQVLSWNYDAGKKLKAHEHLEAPREITYTQEAVVVLSGSLKARIYDRKQSPVTELTLVTGECLVLLEGGHSYEILENGTRALEIKNGPYVGAEADRRRIET